VSFVAPFPGGEAVKVTYLDHQQTSTGSNTFTFSGLSFGPVLQGRYIVACVSWLASPSLALASCTIGGVAAAILTQVQSGNPSGSSAAICIAAVPAGTTGDVVLNWGGAGVVIGSVAVYSIYGIQSPAASAVATNINNSPSVTLNVPANGAVIGISGAPSVSGVNPTWTDLNQDLHDRFSVEDYSSASAAFVLAQTALALTCAWSPTPFHPGVGAFAAFGPP
jgi:hypothetical protein